LRETVDSLEPSHFANPAHAALFAAMRTLPLPDPGLHAQKPVWLNAVLAAARPKASGLGPAYLHQLVQVCPRVEHAAAYARMIVADHVRRTLLVHAEQLGLTATDSTLPDPASAVLAQANTLARYLDSLASQVAPHAGSRPRTSPPLVLPRKAGEEVVDEERMLLASATAHPVALERMRWLHPDDFASPLHGRLFQRGDPVDPVTVLGEAQHRGLLTAEVTPAQVIALLSTPVDSPEYWGERILQRALLAQAHASARRIHTFAEDWANTPHQLVTGSRRALADLTS
jgi:replicative DNA helicase